MRALIVGISVTFLFLAGTVSASDLDTETDCGPQYPSLSYMLPEMQGVRCHSHTTTFTAPSVPSTYHPPQYGRGEAALTAIVNALREEREPTFVYEPLSPQVIYVPVPEYNSNSTPPDNEKTVSMPTSNEQLDLSDLPDQPSQKFCPVGGELYDESVKFCPFHGVALRTQTSGEVKIADDPIILSGKPRRMCPIGRKHYESTEDDFCPYHHVRLVETK